MNDIKNYLVISLNKFGNKNPVIVNNINASDISYDNFDIKIEKKNGFLFIKQYPEDVFDMVTEKITSYMNGYIINLYMRNQRTFFVDDKFWDQRVPTGESLKDIMYKISIMLRKIKRKINEPIQWKVQSQNHSIYFDLAPITGSIKKPDSNITLSALDFDNKTRISKTHVILFDLANPMLIRDITAGPIILCKKERDGENYLRSIPRLNALLILEEAYVMSLYKCIDMFLVDLECLNNDIESVNSLIHIDSEMYFMRRLMKSYESISNGVFVNVKIWRNEFDISCNEYCIDALRNIDNIDVINKALFGNETIPPLVDLSKKEYKFIERYISKKGVLGTDDNIIDMTEILKHPRYGSVLRHSLSHDIVTTFVMDVESDVLRIYFIYHINENMICYISTDFINLKTFNYNDNVFQIKLEFVIKNIDELPNNLGVIIDGIPKEFMDSKQIISMIYDLLSLYIVFHDRPERMKVIKETKKVTEFIRNAKNKPTAVKEKEFVINRILKPTKDAKEYISKVTKTSTSADREYVLEEWNRIGHYRKIKNGSTIWIEATTCKRRLPLTEKEIHIKL